jgi:hypothetical protein
LDKNGEGLDMKSKFKWLIFAYIFSVLAVSSLYAAESDEVTANAISSSAVIITNNTSEDIYYAAFEEKFLTMVKWAPICTNENRVTSKKSVQIPVDFEPSGKVYVYWWHKGMHLMDKEHYGPDKVRCVIVKKR